MQDEAAHAQQLGGEHRGRTFYVVQLHRVRELCERRTRRKRHRKCLSAGSVDLAPEQAAKAGLTPRVHGGWVMSIVDRALYFAQHRGILERCERLARRERRRKRLHGGIADLVRAQAVKAVLKTRAHGSWVVSIADCAFYIAQRRRIRERCERHTRRQRRRESLCAGSANLVPAQAARAEVKPRAHGSWVVSIVGLALYIAQHRRILERCERHTRRQRRRESLRAGSADMVPAQAAKKQG